MRWPWKKRETGHARAVPQKADMPQRAPPEQPDEAARPVAQQAFASLTPRERQVFDGLMQGMKLREIADWLGVKYSTVNTHYKNVYRKLGVNSRAECLIQYASFAGREAGG